MTMNKELHPGSNVQNALVVDGNFNFQLNIDQLNQIFF